MFGFFKFHFVKISSMTARLEAKYLIKSGASFNNCTISVIPMQHLFLCSY